MGTRSDVEDDVVNRPLGQLLEALSGCRGIIFHCHVHLIPRRDGDVMHPASEVRQLIALRQCGGFAGHEGPGSNGGFAPDVLRAALHFVGTSGSFAEALERSLAFAWPANYCPVLVGAIAGARWGASAIPPSSLAHVDILPRVRAAADALAAGWGEDE
jgi:hypothetical protein